VDDEFCAANIVFLLAETWKLQKEDDFLVYLAQVSGRSVSVKPSFDRIIISQAEEGDFADGGLAGESTYWQVDDQGIILVSAQQMVDGWCDRNKTLGDFYITPTIRFYNEGQNILIGERYGPELFSRKVGKLVWQNDRLILTEVRIIFTFDSLRVV
jgi:hypothetical protein